MCGDGTNNAPSLCQAQVSIAVSTTTDVAEAAARLVLTSSAGAKTLIRVKFYSDFLKGRLIQINVAPYLVCNITSYVAHQLH